MKRVKTVGVLPCLITLGNASCGFGAIVKIAQAEYVHGAWLIILAMIFDGLDGRVAKLTRQISEFGAQLDSLSDAISFGVAPALLVALMNRPSDTPGIWPKAVWFFALVYALCAILRLARYNVEARRGLREKDLFRGLPTPAAAGMVASLVIFSHYLNEVWKEDLGEKLLSQGAAEKLSRWIIFPILPAAALILGYLMISSRLRYPHVVNRYVGGKRTFEYFAYLIFVVFLAMAMREVALVAGFASYVAMGPIRFAARARQPDVALRPAIVDRSGEGPEEP